MRFVVCFSVRSASRPFDGQSGAGEVLATCRDDRPYPRRRLLGWSEEVPLHVLIAENSIDQEIILVTVYRPDPVLWDNDFRKRRTP